VKDDLIFLNHIFDAIGDIENYTDFITILEWIWKRFGLWLKNAYPV
jgi:uncharacterized protein with HEPN domain